MLSSRFAVRPTSRAISRPVAIGRPNPYSSAGAYRMKHDQCCGVRVAKLHRRIRAWFIIPAVVALAGCATIRHGGAPEPSFDVDRDLEQLAKQFGEADTITDFYRNPSVDARNRFASGRVTMMNIRYIQFVRQSTSDKQLLDSAAAMLTLGLNLAGTAVGAAGTKTVLAAIAAGVTGSKEVVDQNYYFEKTVPALVAQMNAERKKALIPILVGSRQPLDDYPFAQVVTDLHNYYFAGTYIGALQAIQGDAGAKEQRQDQIIARLVPVSETDIVTKQALTRAIGRLSAADLPKIRQAVQALDPRAAAGTTLAEGQEQLQGYVRGARTPASIAEVAKAFTDAGIPVE